MIRPKILEIMRNFLLLFICLFCFTLMSVSSSTIAEYDKAESLFACCSSYMEIEGEMVEVVRVCQNDPEHSQVVNQILACLRADDIRDQFLAAFVP